MELTDFANDLNEDLANELKHLLFYLRAAAMVRGVHRHHLAVFLKEQAQGEHQHVLAFGAMVVALGGIPTEEASQLPEPSGDAAIILKQALDLEGEVVQNYTARIADLEMLLSELVDEFGPSHEGASRVQYLILFYEEQVEDSHRDLDNLREMVHGVY